MESVEESTVSSFFLPCLFNWWPLVWKIPPLHLLSGILAFTNPLLCWLSTSTTGILRRCCCHHHNLALLVSFCEINMAAKQDALWLSTVTVPRSLAWSILLAFSGLRGWQTTQSQNVEPECGDYLHWDLWGTGGHGRGLLRLLVSWALRKRRIGLLIVGLGATVQCQQNSGDYFLCLKCGMLKSPWGLAMVF